MMMVMMAVMSTKLHVKNVSEVRRMSKFLAFGCEQR
jgi:hypothetical protein